jgi:hypothetical protein
MTSLLRELTPVPIRAFGLDDDDLAAGKGERAGDRESDNARADDEAIDGVQADLPRLDANTLSTRPCPERGVRREPFRHPT